MMKDSKYLKIAVLVLISVCLIGGMLLNQSRISAKKEKMDLASTVERLEGENKKIKENYENLYGRIKENESKENDSSVAFKMNEVANKFVTLYPVYDIQTISDKKKQLNELSIKNVANTIVPEDMIKESEKLKESPEDLNSVYSSDPTFKSFYEDAETYTQYISEDLTNYFSKITYNTTSSSGDTVNTTYIEFSVENVEGKFLVTKINVLYFK
ncbi:MULTISPECIES: hypothetical protein [Vagococcus]|uniref:Uncharacterized protein n=1 Tax=Vagococcus fluvialis bH819 TaxID=1255619 RepID=A0A1X6WS09_9ENTE|nr:MULTISPECIES: hypothetical protein [Vagococcus]SLM87075.1 hypothetical protein FM121_13335 [Vagococcus fluvialis bH819]HCM90578.1 cell division protein FtsL [Vagococcus sp.]